MPHDSEPPTRWSLQGPGSGDDYDANLAARLRGQNPHGEADFVAAFGGRAILDAGCGTGRVGIELARRGFDIVGVDLDASMIDTARRKAPELAWRSDDLATVDLGRSFDTIVLAGNVMIFVAPGTEGSILANLARRLTPTGRLVAGFQLWSGGLTLATYDRLAGNAGLTLDERWATWQRDPFQAGGDYAVSVHRPSAPGRSVP